MKSKFTTVAIVLLAVINILTFVYATQGVVTKNEFDKLQKTLDDKTSKVIVYQGKDGYTPVKGIDYFDGAAGISAMSYTVQTTVIKEVPIIGPQGPAGQNGSNGLDGKNAPYQEIRINPETGDLESKMSDVKWYQVLIPCSQLKVGCPGS